MEIFSSVAVFVLLIFTFKYVFLRSKNTPSSLPLPLPILGHLHLIAKKPLHRTLAKLADKHGPVLFLRYGFRKVLVVSSPSAIEECLTKNDVVFANRPRLIAGQHLGYNYTSLVWSSYGDHWRTLRRFTAAEIFSSYPLQASGGIRSEETRSLVKKLAGDLNFEEYRKVEFKTTFFELMLNVLMRMIAGKRYYGESVVDLEEAREFKGIVKDTFYLLGIPNLGDFLPFFRLFDLQGLKKKMVQSSKRRDAFMQYLIEERKGRNHVTEGNGNTVMIDVLLSRQEAEPEFYTDDVIKGIIATLLTAGTDTSSVTMEWATSLLLNHPEVMDKAREEIDRRVGHERLLEESDLPNLPYLQSIIKETLRLYPAAPIATHESSEDCTVGGVHVTRGTILQLNLWTLHRDQNIWAEALRFKPERFEGEKEGYEWIPFGSGRRKCPGEGLGLRMVGLVLGTLVQCFEWKRIGDDMVDMSEGGGVTMPRVNPLVAMCRPRWAVKTVLTQIAMNK